MYRLSSSELTTLKSQHKKQKRRRDADKIKAVYLLGIGWTLKEVGTALLLSDDTIASYHKSYKEAGIKGLLANKYRGKPPQLTDKEKEMLSQHLEERTYMKTSEIILYVEEEFEASYSASGVRKLLSELGFVYKKPEKRPYKYDANAQSSFLRSYKKLRKGLNKGDSIYFMDATHPEHNPVPAYGWIKRGETKVVRTNPQPFRLNINGAINISTLDMVVSIEESLNKETIKDYLEKLREHQPEGWIYLICDNAGYYSSPEVQALAESMAIKMMFLPPYSPNLNLIERIWKFFKKIVLYNKFYEEFDDMKKACKKFFKDIARYKPELATLMTEKFQTF